MTQSAVSSVKPRLISTRFRGANDGWIVRALFACGHEQDVTFPGAPYRTSKRELAEWTFDAPNRVCSRCERAES